MFLSTSSFRLSIWTILITCWWSTTIVVLGIETQTANFELSNANPNSCEIIVEASRFDGDCCSISKGDDGGCVLNVVNGNCYIIGQYWTLNYTSTYTAAKCPESTDYPDLAPAAFAEDDANGSGGGESTKDDAGSHNTRMMIIPTILFGLIGMAWL